MNVKMYRHEGTLWLRERLPELWALLGSGHKLRAAKTEVASELDPQNFVTRFRANWFPTWSIPPATTGRRLWKGLVC